MPTINSVLGPLDTADLGFTLSHEHVMVTSAGIQYVYPEFIDREGSMRLGLADLREAYAEGLRTIVDVTTIDLGRDIRFLEQVSRESGVQIVCATGTWLDIPREFWKATPNMIAPLYIREIEEGIEGTGIKAGIIKVANDMGGVTPEEEIILRAAARAQKATGVPISTHTYALERVGEEQVRIFEDEGVELSRVYIGHSNETTDTDYLIGLMEKGAWIGMDIYPNDITPGSIRVGGANGYGQETDRRRLRWPNHVEPRLEFHAPRRQPRVPADTPEGEPRQLPVHLTEGPAEAPRDGCFGGDHRSDHGGESQALLRG